MVKLEELPQTKKEIELDQNGNPISEPVKDVPAEKPTFVKQKLTEEEKEERKLAKEPQPENVIYGINISTPDRIKITDINVNVNE